MTAPPPPQIALVEDDETLRHATQQALGLEGMEVRSFADAGAALRWLNADFPGIVVSDVRMPGMDGIAFFARLREIDPDLPVILTTGHGDIDMAVAAMKDGAADFLAKPYSSAQLLRSIRIAADRRALVLENRRLKNALTQRSDRSLIGSSPVAQRLRAVVEAVAMSDIDVVVQGAVGSGKSTAARLLHDLGPRRDRPFVTVDAGILAHQDADLLLFGRERSAGLSRTGMLERAQGGTLFLDELRFHSGQTHARLLAMLDSRSVLPLGADRARKLDVRIILARAPLPDAGSDNAAAALEQRLGAVKIELPALAEHRADIAELFRHFVTLHECELGRDAPEIGQAEWNHLQHHDWPGNLRELSGYARAFVLGLATLGGASGGIGGFAARQPLHQVVADFERNVLEDALRRVGGNVSRLEEALQVPRKTLYDKFKRYDLKPHDYRRQDQNSGHGQSPKN